jgi:hypothetical protein
MIRVAVARTPVIEAAEPLNEIDITPRKLRPIIAIVVPLVAELIADPEELLKDDTTGLGTMRVSSDALLDSLLTSVGVKLALKVIAPSVGELKLQFAAPLPPEITTATAVQPVTLVHVVPPFVEYWNPTLPTSFTVAVRVTGLTLLPKLAVKTSDRPRVDVRLKPTAIGVMVPEIPL